MDGINLGNQGYVGMGSPPSSNNGFLPSDVSKRVTMRGKIKVGIFKKYYNLLCNTTYRDGHEDVYFRVYADKKRKKQLNSVSAEELELICKDIKDLKFFQENVKKEALEQLMEQFENS